MEFTPNFKEIVDNVISHNTSTDPIIKVSISLSANIATRALEEYHNQLWAELKRRKIVD